MTFDSQKQYNFSKALWTTSGGLKITQGIQGLTRNQTSVLVSPDDLAEARRKEANLRKYEAERFQDLQAMKVRANLTVPLEPNAFYHDLGLIEHPFTRKAVANLTAYQIDVWRAMMLYRFLLVIKSQKIGLTTSVLMADLQFAFLPTSHPRSCRGKEIIILAQDYGKAKDHLGTLRQMIHASKKYAPFLIDRPASYLRRDEVSKVTTIYLHNPENPNRPTIIRGLGSNEGAVWSWKNVKHIHISDIAAANIDYDPTINAALTRLVNTRGTMIIETPPRGPRGKVYEIYRQSIEAADANAAGSGEGQFKVKRIHVREAIAAGIVTEEEIEGMRATLGNQFPAYFEAEFITTGGNAFGLTEIEKAINNAKVLASHGVYPDNIEDFRRRNSPRSMGIDPAYSFTGGFAILITELTPDPTNKFSQDDYIQVVYANQTSAASPLAQLENAYELANQYGVGNVYIDDSGAGYIRDLKRMFGEDVNYERRLAECRKDNIDPAKVMRVVPVNFRQHGREMLQNLQYWMHRGSFAVSSDHFNNLLMQLRSAQEVNGNLDKSRDSLDLIDALRLACWDYVAPSAVAPSMR